MSERGGELDTDIRRCSGNDLVLTERRGGVLHVEDVIPEEHGAQPSPIVITADIPNFVRGSLSGEL